MNRSQLDRGPSSAAARHERAVENTLREADQAAACGDYEGALSWLGLVEAIGDDLPHTYKLKRATWTAQSAPS
jgi:hypothetical protein